MNESRKIIWLFFQLNRRWNSAGKFVVLQVVSQEEEKPGRVVYGMCVCVCMCDEMLCVLREISNISNRQLMTEDSRLYCLQQPNFHPFLLSFISFSPFPPSHIGKRLCYASLASVFLLFGFTMCIQSSIFHRHGYRQ